MRVWREHGECVEGAWRECGATRNNVIAHHTCATLDCPAWTPANCETAGPGAVGLVTTNPNRRPLRVTRSRSKKSDVTMAPLE